MKKVIEIHATSLPPKSHRKDDHVLYHFKENRAIEGNGDRATVAKGTPSG